MQDRPQMAVSVNWESFWKVSFYDESYYVGHIFTGP